jgi:hypothetical protein
LRWLAFLYTHLEGEAVCTYRFLDEPGYRLRSTFNSAAER